LSANRNTPVSRHLLVMAGLGLYYLFLRPQMQKYGTRLGESQRRLPGDEFIPKPNFLMTHAVNIDAPPEAVWPWLAQMGRERTGYYGLDLLTNQGIPSVTFIRQDIPAPEVGMEMDGGYRIIELEPNRKLLFGGFNMQNLAGITRDVTTLYLLERHQEGSTRLTESELLRLNIVWQEMEEANDNNPVRALRTVLAQAIENLKPEGQRSLTTTEWILYNILEMRFLQGRKVRDVARRLAMSESDLYRKQRIAIEEVARQIEEMEQNTLEESPRARPSQINEHQEGSTRLLVRQRGFTYGMMGPIFNALYEIVYFLGVLQQFNRLKPYVQGMAHLRA
jgi:hypothetical protein